MRDIGRRIKRYRLSRYAPPEDRVHRGLRWVWVLAALWLVWIGVISDHSLWRIWRLSLENTGAHRQVAEARGELERIDRDLRDTRSARDLAEKELREKHGMAGPGEIIYRVRGDAPDSVLR
mgnify:CR=1 FL=1